MNPQDKSPVKIVWKGADRFTLRWLEEGGDDSEVPPDIYNRLR
jgi:hypothetical protein